MTSDLRAAFGLIVLVVATHANVLNGDFHYDDFHSLVDNPAVRDLGNVADFLGDKRMFSVDADKSMYRPLLLFSYSLQYAMHGYQAAGFLAINILIHLGCVLLLWRLARRLGAAAGTAVVAASLFAVHPVAGEAVNYVSSRSESLAAFCMLAALLLYLRGDMRSRGGSLVLFVAALLTKATASALPLVLSLHELRGKVDRSQSLRRLSPYGLVLVVYVGWLSSLQLLPDDRSEPVRSLLVQLATQLKAVPWYLHLLSLPAHQNIDPSFSEGVWFDGAVWLSAGLLLSLLFLLRTAPTKFRFWLLWPLLVALPASVVPLNVLVNEHRVYLAAAGLCVAFASLTQIRSLGGKKHWPGWALVALLAILGWQRNAVWETEKSLWADAATHGPQGGRAHVHWGNALRSEGSLAAAGSLFAQALEVEPGNLAAHANLASVYYEQALIGQGGGVDFEPVTRQLDRAEAQFQHVLSIDPDHREAMTNLGGVYRLRGENAKAVATYQAATEAHPRHPEAWANWSDLAFDAGQYSHAALMRQRVVQLEPAVGAGYRRLGDALARNEDLPGASEAYGQACRLDPADMGACYNLAEVLRVRGDVAWSQDRGDQANALWTDAGNAYRHVLQRVGDFRQAQQQEERLRQLLGEGQ
jgi:Flp pilus assembly protein TadD